MQERIDRKYEVSISELIDRMTIDQIKLVKLPETREAVASEIKDLAHDVDLVLGRSNLRPSAGLILKISLLAQINLHIWHNKELMQADPERYTQLLVEVHQLNGVRNRLKNSLLDDIENTDVAKRHTNTEIDALELLNLGI